MEFVGCFSSFEGNQWLNSSKFWNKCVRHSVEVCHRLSLSTIFLPRKVLCELYMFWISSDTCGSWQNWLIYLPQHSNFQCPSRNQLMPAFLRRTTLPVPSSSFPRCNLENVSPESVTQATHQTAKFFCKLILSGEDLQQCLKMWSEGWWLRRRCLQVPGYHRAMNIMIIMWPQRRSDSSLRPSAPAVPGLRVRQPQNLWFRHSMQVSLSLSHSIAILCKCDQVWLIVFLGCHNVSQTSGFGGQKSQSKHQKDSKNGFKK